MVTRKRSAAVVKKTSKLRALCSKLDKKANRSCFRASLALCSVLLPWKTHRIHGSNWFTSNDKKQNFLAEPQPSMWFHSLACGLACGGILWRWREGWLTSREGKIHFSLWVIDCDVQDALLFRIVIISMVHDFLWFYIVVSKCDEWKEEAFLWSAQGDS